MLLLALFYWYKSFCLYLHKKETKRVQRLFEIKSTAEMTGYNTDSLLKLRYNNFQLFVRQ